MIVNQSESISDVVIQISDYSRSLQFRETDTSTSSRIFKLSSGLNDAERHDWHSLISLDPLTFANLFSTISTVLHTSTGSPKHALTLANP